MGKAAAADQGRFAACWHQVLSLWPSSGCVASAPSSSFLFIEGAVRSRHYA
jgi:hypothetical protein